MVAIPLGACLMQGDLLDGVVESTLRNIADQLKAEFRKELGKALDAAAMEAADGSGVDRGDAPPVSVPGLNMPARAELAGDQAGGPAESKAAHRFEFPAMEDSDGIESMRLSPGRSIQKASSTPNAWRESARMVSCGESVASAEKSRTKPALTEQDQAEIMRIRAEEIARAEAAEKAGRDLGLSMFDQPTIDEGSRCKTLLYKLIASPKFDFGMGVVIILNAVTIGMETSISRHGDTIPLSLHVLEYTFLLLYCVELGIRVHVGGRQVFLNNWVKFDAMMVAAGTLNVLLTVTSLGGDAAAGVVDNVNMLKMIRLFRLAKTVRVLVQFRTLWMLVQGLMYAVMPMFWTAILMTVVIYVFAVIAMETISVSDADGDSNYSIAAHQYDTLGGSMRTLMQFMTLDSVATIYRPLIFAKPWLLVYFLVFLLLGPIALMNIVTAAATATTRGHGVVVRTPAAAGAWPRIMVESSLRTANEDQEAKKAWENVRRKNMMPKLRNMFLTLDTSGDGEVDLEEVLNAPTEIKEAMQHIVGLDQLEEVFHLLDYDGSGSVDIEEFVEGILRSQGEKPSELFVILKQGKAILNRSGRDEKRCRWCQACQARKRGARFLGLGDCKLAIMPLLWALWELALLGAASSRDVDASSDSERYAPSVDISLYKAFEFATLSTGGPKQPSMKILSAAGLEDLNQLAGTRLKEMEQYAQDALTNKVLLAREEMNLSRQRFQAVADQVAKEVEARTARLEQQWLQLAVASGHGQVGKCCCPQDEDCVWHNFAAGGDRDCPVGMQDYRDRVKPGATGLTSSGAVDMLLAQCVNSTGWTERPWALPGAPAGAAEAAGPAQEPAGAEAAEGPWRGAGPAGPAELGDGTVLPPSGGAEAAAPLEPLGEEDPAQDAIQVEARVPLPSDEDLIDKDSELLEPVIPGGSPAILDSPLLVPKAPAVEEEEAPLVTPVKPQEDPLVKPENDWPFAFGDRDPAVKPGSQAAEDRETRSYKLL
ncbi:unnamed protein product [Prorocentrum cordatum]|uniref:EF-hand domain-containing protein n=1 Tax=Prorocentrum cordatum TaxID=2364126 RepID=A0ABN9U269_9DINO|nr:unnamed protein product [Polarella glacialis]